MVERRPASFSMDNIVCMDLETSSVRDTGGAFMVYAVGWLFGGQYRSLVANTSEELRTNDPAKLIPPLYGALLKSEQDVQLFERLAFLNRRERANS